MPLKKGSSDSTVGGNIKELMHAYDRKGEIGTSHPAGRQKAQKQAVAIAMSKARESGGGKRSRASAATAKKSTAMKTTSRSSASRSLKSTTHKSSTRSRSK